MLLVQQEQDRELPCQVYSRVGQRKRDDPLPCPLGAGHVHLSGRAAARSHSI